MPSRKALEQKGLPALGPRHPEEGFHLSLLFREEGEELAGGVAAHLLLQGGGLVDLQVDVSPLHIGGPQNSPSWKVTGSPSWMR